MKKIVLYFMFFGLLLGSCQKEDIHPNGDETVKEDDINNKSDKGGFLGNDGKPDDGVVNPITDPNNDEDENKSKKKDN